MNAKPMRLIRGKQETRQERALREIRERRTGENVEQGQGEIDNTPMARTIDVEEVLKRSYRPTDWEK